MRHIEIRRPLGVGADQAKFMAIPKLLENFLHDKWVHHLAFKKMQSDPNFRKISIDNASKQPADPASFEYVKKKQSRTVVPLPTAQTESTSALVASETEVRFPNF